jgi:hypothetical protein
LSLTARVTSASSENSLSNNVASKTPIIEHPVLAISQDEVAVNSHCTGTGLSAYFECTTAPSSITQHSINLWADGSITIDGEPSFSGEWQQDAARKGLTFQYYESGNKVAEFVGWAVGTSCFEGMTNFPGSSYVSPYRVCLQ